MRTIETKGGIGPQHHPASNHHLPPAKDLHWSPTPLRQSTFFETTPPPEACPLAHMRIAKSYYKDAGRIINEHLAKKLPRDPNWPSWCFLPFELWDEIYLNGMKDNNFQIPMSYDVVTTMMALTTWRYTQGIYRFTPNLARDLAETDIKGDIPVERLLRIPQPCIYIDTTGIPIDMVYGFWALLDWDSHNKSIGMRLLLNTTHGLRWMYLPIGDWSVEEAICKEAEYMHTHFGMPQQYMESERNKALAKFLAPLLSMILFLCSDKPDIDGERCPGSVPSRPAPKKIRRGIKLFAPHQPHVWVVGKETEKKIEEAQQFVSNMIRIHGLRIVSPHIRRAHWHGVWNGPRNGERMFSLYWQPITIVGLSNINGKADNYEDDTITPHKGR